MNSCPPPPPCSFNSAARAGVPVSRLHTKTLLAGKNSPTGGVGERMLDFVEGEGVTAVVLGTRGLGSVKRCARLPCIDS